jgi:hypothetical protein
LRLRQLFLGLDLGIPFAFVALAKALGVSVTDLLADKAS